MRYFCLIRPPIIIILICAAAVASSAEVLTAVDAALKKMYISATDFERQDIHLGPEEVAGIEAGAGVAFGSTHSAHVIRYTARGPDGILGYAFEDTVMGKWGPIHYLVGITSQGTVADVAVLDYQEIRGRPVAKKRFLRQYKNKSVQDPVQLGKDIDGVTGATISSRSMTDGVRKLVHVFRVIQSK